MLFHLTPIAIGTGTKGKVLDALANGLLVVGTPYALENIAVENGVSCVEYHSTKELFSTLVDIPYNVQKYEQIQGFASWRLRLSGSRRLMAGPPRSRFIHAAPPPEGGRGACPFVLQAPAHGGKTMSRPVIAVYPGTFDPITLGHEDIARHAPQ